MLAQTCSQIGADPGPKVTNGNDKTKLTSSSKSKPAAGGGSSPVIVVSDSSKPVSFKPYETKEGGSSPKAVESKRTSDAGSSKSNSPHFDTRLVFIALIIIVPYSTLFRSPRDAETGRNGYKSVSPKQSTSSARYLIIKIIDVNY